MSSPLINAIIKRKNDLKTWIIIGAFLLIVIVLLAAMVFSKHHQSKHISNNSNKTHLESFDQIAEFGQSATGVAIGNLQNAQSTTTAQIKSLEDDNKKLMAQNQQISSTLDAVNKSMAVMQKKVV